MKIINIVANEISAPQIRIADIVKEIEKRELFKEDDEEETSKDEEEEYYEDVKTRAYIKDNEIILE